MTHDFTFFRYRKDGEIGRLTLNRPDVLNAFHYPAVREFERLVELVADDPDTRLVTIVGEGRAFSTGMMAGRTWAISSATSGVRGTQSKGSRR